MSDRNPGRIKDPETGKIDPKEIWYKVRSAFAVLLSLGVLVGGGWIVYDKAQEAWQSFQTSEDYEGAGVDPVVVTIPQGATLSEISDLLVAANVVKTSKAFNKEAAANEQATKIQPGEYNLLTELPARSALAMLLDKKNMVRNWMTLPEGKWVSQQVATLSKATGLPKADFEAAIKDWKSLGLPKWAKNGLEGFLFPDTYEVPEKPKAQSVLKMATKQFNNVANDLDLVNGAKSVGLTPYEVVVMASVIEKEAGPNDEDRAKIARVFYNRLKANSGFGGKLQSDATVAYANKITGRVFTTKQERKLDSPWNTYKYAGLPKGPITSPSKKSLEAALHPADGNWTYFMVVNLDTGETLFTNSLAEHNANGDKLDAWCNASPENKAKCK
jgi:UPF0755 protein